MEADRKGGRVHENQIRTRLGIEADEDDCVWEDEK